MTDTKSVDVPLYVERIEDDILAQESFCMSVPSSSLPWDVALYFWSSMSERTNHLKVSAQSSLKGSNNGEKPSFNGCLDLYSNLIFFFILTDFSKTNLCW